MWARNLSMSPFLYYWALECPRSEELCLFWLPLLLLLKCNCPYSYSIIIIRRIGEGRWPIVEEKFVLCRVFELVVILQSHDLTCHQQRVFFLLYLNKNKFFKLKSIYPDLSLHCFLYISFSIPGTVEFNMSAQSAEQRFRSITTIIKDLRIAGLWLEGWDKPKPDKNYLNPGFKSDMQMLDSLCNMLVRNPGDVVAALIAVHQSGAQLVVAESSPYVLAANSKEPQVNQPQATAYEICLLTCQHKISGFGHCN